MWNISNLVDRKITSFEYFSAKVVWVSGTGVYVSSGYGFKWVRILIHWTDLT